MLAACAVVAAAPLAVAQDAEREGVLLLDVTEEGPAARAGLARGAILLEVAGVVVDTTSGLVEVLQQHAGRAVQIRYRFGNAERTVRVQLGDGEDAPLLGVVPETLAPRFGPLGGPRLDLDLEPFLQANQGALVLEVAEDSPAERAGLTEADIITAVDGEPVGGEAVPGRRSRGDDRRGASSGDSLGEMIAAHRPGDRVQLEVRRGDETLTLSATLAPRPDSGGGAYLGVQYRPASGVIYRFQSPDGSPNDDERLRERLEERWRGWLRGAPGSFTGRLLLPI